MEFVGVSLVSGAGGELLPEAHRPTGKLTKSREDAVVAAAETVDRQIGAKFLVLGNLMLLVYIAIASKV